MKIQLALCLALVASATAFVPQRTLQGSSECPALAAESLDRRSFGSAVWGAAALAAATLTPGAANAQVAFDPAMYGDQELRISAVDSVKERVRRAILQDPKLVTSFLQLSLLDGLSYEAKSNLYGPDGTIIYVVLSSKDKDENTLNLQKAALVLVETEKFLRKKNAVSLADAVAIGGAEAVESIGGPILTVQLGRADTTRDIPINTDIPLNLLSGDCPTDKVIATFAKAGLTEREMTALLTALMTVETVQKTRTSEDWKVSAKPKFREAGKLGRMSEFQKLTDEDIAEAEAQAALEADLEADPDFQKPDAWYIADSFGSREERFGERLAKGQIDEKSFNKFIQIVDKAINKKDKTALAEYGWIAKVLEDPSVPTVPQWLNKYATSNLNYKKDLSTAYNSVTQLGAQYTGGKYESLLKRKKRKTLNDDELNLF